MLSDLFKHLKNTQIFVKYKEKISEYNADSLGLFLTFGVIISAAALILELVLLRTRDFWAVVVLLIYFVIGRLLYQKHIHDKVDHSKALLYLAQIPVIAATIIMGTMVNPDTKAFTFLIVLLAFPLFLLDRPRNLIIYIVSVTACFIAMDCRFKSGILLRHDILHCLITFLFSLCAILFVMEDRIENVEKSLTFLKDSEHDPLTGIYNRRGGEEKIKEYIGEKMPGTFIILDIDDFKHVNDTYGHAMGDEVLSAVSMTLSSSFRSSDIVMRMGGDEFIVYAPGLVNYFFIDGKLTQINARMREITCASGRDNITVSMGAVINDGTYPTYEALFNEADTLLYEMKQHGKNGFRLQDRTYEEVLKRGSNRETAARARAEREAASNAEEEKYRK